MSAVLFVKFNDGSRIVVKQMPDLSQAADVMFCKALCDRLMVCHPACDVLCGEKFDAFVEGMRSATKEGSQCAGGWNRIKVFTPPLLVMECVKGQNISPNMPGVNFSCKDPAASLALLTQPGIVDQLGRMTALDMILNNWDRLPWVPKTVDWKETDHTYSNPSNIMITSDLSTIVAIDTEMNDGPRRDHGGTQGKVTVTDEQYLAELKKCVSDLCQSQGAGESHQIADLFRAAWKTSRQLDLDKATAGRYQSAVVEGLEKIRELGPEFDAMLQDAHLKIGYTEGPSRRALRTFEAVRLLNEGS